MAIYKLEFQSAVNVSTEVAWHWVTSWDGIRREMSPLLEMTAPAEVKNIQDVEVEPGRPLFTSCLLLFGLLPIDRSQLTLVNLDEGQGFVEQSPMQSMRLWRHERLIVKATACCVVQDRLTFEPRFGGMIAAWCVKVLFKHRHRMLRRHLV